MLKQIQNTFLFPRTLKPHGSRVAVVFGLFVLVSPLFSYTRAFLPASLTRVGLGPQTAYAATSDNLNFQARLETSAGAIAADGYYNLQFKLYDAPTGGTLLWTETYYDSNGVTAGNDNRVRVANGYVTVNLGSQTAFPSTMPWDQQLYLTMNVGGTTQTATPTWDGEMNPRLKLTAVPYAFNAKTASQVITTSGALSSTLSIQAPSGGNQIFQIPDQGAAGTYTLLTGSAANGMYIQLQGSLPGTVQTGNFNINGTGRAGGLQAPSLDSAASGVLTIGATNATNIQIGSGTTDATARLFILDSYNNGTDPTGYDGAMYYNTSLNKFRCYINGAWADCDTTGGGSGVTTIGVIDSQAKSSNGAVISGTTMYMQNADGSFPGLVSTGTQTFAGDKTFAGNIVVSAGKSLTLTGGNTASRPASPTEGMVYYDTTTKQLLTYANGKWQADRTEAIIVAASNSSTADKAAADYVATGTADQTTINTALTAADPAGSGRKTGKVVLLAGTYTTTDVISVPNNTTLAGVGRGTLIQFGNIAGQTKNMVTNTSQGAGAGEGMTVRDLQLDGNKAVNTTGTMHGIYTLNMGSGSGSTAKQGITVTNVWVNNFISTGIYIESSSNSAILSSTAQGNGGDGINVKSSNRVNVSNNIIQGNTAWGVHVSGALAIAVNGNNVANNGALAGYNSSGGIVFDGTSQNNAITNNAFRDNGTGTGASNATVYFSNASNNTVTGNVIADATGTTGYAIYVFDAASTGNYFAGNAINGTFATVTLDNGTNTVWGGQLTGNNGTGAYLIQNAGGVNVTSSTASTGTTGAVTISTGNNSGGASGNISIDVGTATTTKGTISIGTTTATTIGIGNAGSTTTIQGNTGVTLSATTGTTMVCRNGSGYLSSCDATYLAPTAGNFVQNQNTAAQTANFWVNGSGRVDGQTTLGGGSNQTQLIIKANASQSASNPLIMFQNSAGTELSRIRVTADSTYFGKSSGDASSGLGNTAVGALALQATSSGNSNSAFGYQALNSNTGSDNTALGNQALYQNTSGSSNTAIGSGTMGANTIGGYNVAIGNGTLLASVNGSGNTGIGYNSLLASTGDGNTAIGRLGLSSNVGGSYNTALGYYAGYQDANATFSTLTNLQRATAIGAYAQVQQSDSIVLGSVDNPTKVGIGITVPSNTLSVSPLDYQTGTVTRTNSSATLTGTGTTWTAAMVGDIIVFADGTTNTVSAFTDATHITMGTTYAGTTDAAPVYYRFHKAGLNVTSTGTVGINTTTPNSSYALDVNGTVNASTSVITPHLTYGGEILINPTSNLRLRSETGNVLIDTNQFGGSVNVGTGGAGSTGVNIGPIDGSYYGTVNIATSNTNLPVYLTMGSSGTGGQTIVQGGETSLKFVSGGGALLKTTTNLTTAFTIQNANSVNVMNVDTTNGVAQLGSYNGGTNPVAGKLSLANTTNANTVTLQSTATAGNYTATIPAITANDTFCMVTLANCSGGGGGANTSLSNLTATNINQPLNTTAGNLTLQTTTSGNINIAPAGTISLQSDTTLAAGKSLTISGGITGTRPASPVDGMVYYDTTTKQLLTYNAALAKWVASGKDAILVAANNSSPADQAVADFVAAGTADQTIINNALTAANPAGSGRKTGKVVMLGGTYTINAAISVPNNTTLSGVGSATLITIPNALNATFSFIQNTDQTTGTGVVVRDLRIDGNKANQTVGTMNGIFFNNVGINRAGGSILNMFIANMYGGTCIGGFMSYTTISSNYCEASVSGINVGATSSYMTVSNNTSINNSGYGFSMTNLSYSTVSNNIAKQNVTAGFSIYMAYGSVVGNVSNGNGTGILASGTYSTYSGNTLSGNTTNGIALNLNSNRLTITGNNIHDSGGATTNEGIYISPTIAINDNVITGNNITDTSCTTTCYAIDISNSNANNTVLSGNTFKTTSGVATINDSGTATVFSGQAMTQGGIDMLFKQANSTSALGVQNASGVSFLNMNTSGSVATIGNTIGATSVVLSAGTGGISIGNGAIANTIQIGNTTGAVAQTINIGNNATASSTSTVVIGSTVGSSTTNIQAGTGGINLTGMLGITGPVNTSTVPASWTQSMILNNAATSTDNILEFRVAGTRNGSIRSSFAGGNRNIIINGAGTGAVYLGWDEGTGGIFFGNGSAASVGSITSTGNLSVSGTGTFSGTATQAGGTTICMNGTTIVMSSAACTNASSIRYKENVVDMSNALNVIGSLRPVSFNWKNSSGYTAQNGGMYDYGLIAEEVNNVIPTLVSHDATGQIDGLNYSAFVPFLVKGMQEQQGEINSLTNSVATLQSIDLTHGGTISGNININGSLDVTGNVTLAGNLETADIYVNGHIVTKGAVPTVAAGGALGQGVLGINTTNPVITNDGTDGAGTITVTPGAQNASSGVLAHVIFARAFTSSYKVVVSASNDHSADLRLYVTKTTTGFDIVSRDPVTAGTQYSIDYIVLGAQN